MIVGVMPYFRKELISKGGFIIVDFSGLGCPRSVKGQDVVLGFLLLRENF